ncbi:MAG: prephenate dehydratase [Flavobacteriaceae bacterium]|nr:prephenate dehydratase [Flavobacteriaceae bacterium]|tara:strand:+ start:43179 stop:44012 length:834 start_codon:yes stop_codon:yes gene_type:complete
MEEKKLNIGIQGIKGSYHHIASESYFNENFNLRECLTFDHLVNEIEKSEIDMGVMAIENSIAGSIIPNYALIDQNNLLIVGEVYFKINHNLMALNGQNINQINEVFSHPMALLQCKSFFSEYPHIRLVESDDTAYEAMRISKNNIKGVAAIASVEAAKYYNLNVLFKSIQTIKNNITRFVIIQKRTNQPIIDNINKASLKFILDDKRGSLAAVLNAMSDCKLNLTKIQSLPVIEKPGKYAFFVDLIFDDINNYLKAKKIISIMASHFKVLGEYSNGL